MSKARVAELVQRLRDAAKTQEPAAMAAVELVKLVGLVAQESLVSAEGDDMLRAQGAARTLAKLHTDLTRTPPNIAQEPTA